MRPQGHTAWSGERALYLLFYSQTTGRTLGQHRHFSDHKETGCQGHAPGVCGTKQRREALEEGHVDNGPLLCPEPGTHRVKSGVAPLEPVALEGPRFTFWPLLSAMLSSD